VIMTTQSTILRRGFTLVELLAVLATIGGLIGLLLPALMQTREAARRMQCSNNLKQMGLALTNYEVAKKRFPAGNDQIGDRQHAWSSFILPFLEQAAVSNRVDYAKKWDDPTGNAALAEVIIPTYVCPSGMKSFAGKQDYGGVLGASINTDGTDLAIVSRGNDLRYLSSGVLYATGTAVYPMDTLPRQQPRQPASAASITDGLSRTLFVTEAVDREQEGRADTHLSGDACWAHGANCFFLNNRVINVPDADGFKSLHLDGVYGLFGDGRVTFISDRTEPTVLIAISTKSGGEVETLGL